jgi:putative glutamine amidotransferase
MQELGVSRGCQLRDIEDQLHRSVTSTGGDRWAFAHALGIRPGGFLDSLGLHDSEASPELMVNSQHSQVVDALPSSVRIEAVAPDGLIEAISVDWPQRWLVGIQWHCEQRTEDSRLDQRILQAFGERCRNRKQRRTQC